MSVEERTVTSEEFSKQLRRNGDMAVNFRTGKMFKSIVKGIFRDVRSALTPDARVFQLSSEKRGGARDSTKSRGQNPK